VKVIFNLRVFFDSKAGANPGGTFMGLHFEGSLFVLPTNIRLGWKLLAVTILARACNIKHSTAVIYEFLQQARVFVSGKPFQLYSVSTNEIVPKK
jgi:hypothetical protein